MDWISENQPEMSRPEAIRRLVRARAEGESQMDCSTGMVLCWCVVGRCIALRDSGCWCHDISVTKRNVAADAWFAVIFFAIVGFFAA